MRIELNRKAGLNPLLAVQSLAKGTSLLGHKTLRKYIIIPVLINLILFSGLLYWGYYSVGLLITQFIPDWLQWLEGLIYPLFFIGFFMAGFFTFTLIANLIASPFYGGLAAKTLQIINCQPSHIQPIPISAALGAELKRIIYLLSRAIPIVIISIIPGLNLLAPILWGLFGAWGMSMQYFAYTLENEGVLFSEQHQVLKSVRIGSLSFGTLVLLGSMIPLLNMLIPPIAVISATLYRQRLAVDSLTEV